MNKTNTLEAEFNAELTEMIPGGPVNPKSYRIFKAGPDEVLAFIKKVQKKEQERAVELIENVSIMCDCLCPCRCEIDEAIKQIKLDT